VVNGALPPVGALVRRPAVSVRRRVVAALHDAGFTDLQPAHLAVFTWPGPDGLRPGMLATRADASKQAMNHLLGQLEGEGYIVRDSDPSDRRTRIVHLTPKGREAWEVVQRVVGEVEAEWRDVLGETGYDELRHKLAVLNEHFDRQPGS
jgi:DNA-binding MarR family transcriptional regulator